MDGLNNYELAEQDYIAGMKYKEIAEKYGVSINTVKSWKKRYAWTREKKEGCTQKGCTQNKKGAHKKEAIAEDISQVIENDQLTDQQRLFCLYYVRYFNATKAYLKVSPGCTYYSASVIGSRWLKNPVIREEIESLKQNRMNRELFGEDDLFQMYLDIARADMTDFAEVKDGWVMVKDSDKLDGTIIQELSMGKTGPKIKLADRMKALDWLTEHIGMATEKQKAELELLRARTQKISGDGDGSGESDDGFLEALSGTAAEDWADEEN